MLNSLLKVFVGDKTKKDLKKLWPLVQEIKSFESQYKKLSHDELRQKTLEFKREIEKARKPLRKSIDELNEKVSQTEDLNEKESIYQEIDQIETQIHKTIDELLFEMMPRAYALIKETATRFYHHKSISVKTTPHDRLLASKHDYLELNSELTIWHHHWDAAGKPIIWDMIHYDVQLLGGIVLHQGKIAEMQTGEGKTLVATLPVYLNALTGNGVHIVTVNDYLAKRDSAWMAPIFEFHGLTIDCIDHHKPNSPERRAAYQADITYGTNNEFGFDYLRDNMAHSIEDLVQRKHHYAIVDEVDSVLIDDARTPLIISGPTQSDGRQEFDDLKGKVSSLVAKQRTMLNSVLSQARMLIKEGDVKQGGLLLLRVHRGLPKHKALIKFLSQEGIRQLLQKTENFYMQDNNREMPKVDAELYFVIEEKNNQIDLTDKGIEYLSQDTEDKNFFVLPDIGIEIVKIQQKNLEPQKETELKQQLFQDFEIKSERIHTMNQLLKAYTLFEKDTQYVVIENKVKIVDEQTGRIMEGRRYSDGLHQAIEAKENVNVEAATQTFATITLQNYFRKYHKLAGMTGTASTEAGEFWQIYKLDVVEIPTNKVISRKDKNDLIYKTKREKYKAVIQNVSNLSKEGRPVLIGTTSVEISELISKMLVVGKIKHNVLNAKLHKKEAQIVAEAGNPGVVTIATNMAGRGTDIKLTQEVINAGGLAIVGTERHDSRRVDRQLRGRAGRQGDPGSSQFYVSLEDNLMRLFGSERVSKIMDRLGLKEGEVIQHSMMTRSIERAQKKVEENNFGIRKRLLEYDDVMSAQREVIYKRRRHALESKRLKFDILNLIFDTCEEVLLKSKPNNDYNEFEIDVISRFALNLPVDKQQFENDSESRLTALLYNSVLERYEQRCRINTSLAYQVIKNVVENQSRNYKRIIIPFTNGVRTINVVTDLQNAYNTKGENLVDEMECKISLALIDEAWKNHLRKMDELKQSVQLAVHEQKDPLLIYKFESFELFQAMINDLNREIASFLIKGSIPIQANENVKEATTSQRKQNYRESKDQSFNSQQLAEMNRQSGGQTQRPIEKVETFKRDTEKIGRNEMVQLTNVSSGEIKSMKYKRALPLIESGSWVLDNV
ncbi:MAG: preprotein translocase subunit SecA [Flavobacteriaceae bacterium]|nr:preprotein translocase subunit SecA [Flavobacteriaceae bacterium]MCY4267331.1 preprotein translocase subunit SecA [Flavobacteriaceae bacterium]